MTRTEAYAEQVAAEMLDAIGAALAGDCHVTDDRILGYLVDAGYALTTGQLTNAGISHYTDTRGAAATRSLVRETTTPPAPEQHTADRYAYAARCIDAIRMRRPAPDPYGH